MAGGPFAGSRTGGGNEEVGEMEGERVEVDEEMR